jgi:hypothetical protein
MGLCWPLQVPPTPKAVLMSLADQANDQGVCWPAIGSIVKRTCLSERAVQNAISWLQQSGVLVLKREQGRATTYQIIPDGLGTQDLFTAPARHAPPQQVHPRTTDTTPPQQVHPTPAGDAPHPRTTCTQNRNRTIKEPKQNRKSPGAFDAESMVLPAWLDPSDWSRWVKDRKDRKKPLTEEAAKLSIAMLDKHRADGFTPQQVIDNAIAAGWQGLYPPIGNKRSSTPAVDMAHWWRTDAGVDAKGAELGIERGNAPGTFEARVWVAAGDGPWWDDTKATTYRIAKKLREEGVLA